MPKQAYFPRTEAEQVTWLTNFKTKLPIHAGAVGIATGEATAFTDGIDFYLYLYNLLTAQKSDLEELSAYKRSTQKGTGAAVPLPAPTVLGTPPAACAPGLFTRIAALVQRIKNHPGYTAAIGEDLGVIGAEDTTTHTTPDFKLVILDGSPNQTVEVQFKKFEHEGVQVEMRRPQFSSPWTVLGNDTSSPYLDATPLQAGSQPETREYRLRFWDEGEPNGDYSAVKQVTVR